MGDESPELFKKLMLLYQLKQLDDVLLYADKLKKADPNEKVAFLCGSDTLRQNV